MCGGGEGTCEGWASKSKSECKRGGSQEFEQQADTLSTMELTCPGLRTSIMSSGKQVLDSHRKLFAEMQLPIKLVAAADCKIDCRAGCSELFGSGARSPGAPPARR